MKFRSPSKNELSFDEMFEDILDSIKGKPEQMFKLIIGTDSRSYNKTTCFVSAVIVYRIGKGARYFYRKKKERKIESLKQRITYETLMSLEIAALISEKLAETGHEELNMEIHIDIGPKGETRDLIREIVGMVVGSGYNAKIKPDSCGASKVADKYTK